MTLTDRRIFRTMPQVYTWDSSYDTDDLAQKLIRKSDTSLLSKVNRTPRSLGVRASYHS